MIQCASVTLSFSGVPLFENASFTVQKGERCAIVGRNGSGKSTLFKLIVGEMESDNGHIAIPKDYRIGYLQQHIKFTQKTLREEAALGLPENEKEELYKAESILFGLGFTSKDLERDPSEFSGGYQLRLHLAKVLVSQPDCLLLDEPTNYLDILSIRWLQVFLREWKGEFMLISHERDFMDAVCTHTLGIHRNKVKKIKGSTLAFFEQLLEEEEIHEKTRLKSDKKRQKTEQFIERFGAKATKASQAQSRKKMLDREPILERLNALDNLSFHFQEAPFPGKKMVEATSIAFSYTQEKLIHDVSIQIEKGERVAIIGKNGRGKSTLLQLLSAVLAPKEGRLFLSDNVKMGIFGQTHIQHLNPAHTIVEEISAANRHLNYTEVKGIAGKMLFSGETSEKKISLLSGGEKSRVLLGKILAHPCNLLMLDEPTHHLDIESVEALIDALEDFEGAVVIVTHSELILKRLQLDKIIVCESGRQEVFLGDYDLFLEKLGWEEEKKVSSKPKREEAPKKVGSQKSLEKKIRECEEKIAKLEEEQKRASNVLEHGLSTPELLKAMGVTQVQIDRLYLDLEELHRQAL